MIVIFWALLLWKYWNTNWLLQNVTCQSYGSTNNVNFAHRNECVLTNVFNISLRGNDLVSHMFSKVNRKFSLKSKLLVFNFTSQCYHSSAIYDIKLMVFQSEYIRLPTPYHSVYVMERVINVTFNWKNSVWAFTNIALNILLLKTWIV